MRQRHRIAMALMGRVFFGVFINSFLIQEIRAAEAVWRPLGPEGGGIATLAVAPSAPQIVYAGAHYSGIFRSEDGGASWVSVHSDLNAVALAVDPEVPTTVYAGVDWKGVYKSEDGGTSWSATELHNVQVTTLSIVPGLPPTVYAVASGELHKSEDGGTSWSASRPDSHEVRSLALSPSRPTTLYVGTQGGGVFKSEDGGTSWASINAGLMHLEVAALAVHPEAPATVYAGVDWGGVYKSEDGGTNWTASNTGLSGLFVFTLAIAPSTPPIAYAITNNGFFTSKDGGATWASVPDLVGLVGGAAYNALFVDPRTPLTVYAGTRVGVYKSTDGGARWRATNKGLFGPIVTTLAVDPTEPSTVYAGGHGTGVYKSVNEGATWTAIPNGLTNLEVQILAVDPQAPRTVYAGTYGYGGMYKSEDGGALWTAITAGLDGRSVIALEMDPRIPTTLYAGTSLGGVYKSEDGGGSWRAVHTGLPFWYTRNREKIMETVYGLAVDPGAPRTVYAGTGVGVYKTEDGGETWREANTVLMPEPETMPTTKANTEWPDFYVDTLRYVQALAVVAGTPTIVYAGTDEGLFTSRDGGATWTRSSPFRHVRCLAIDPGAPAIVYAGTSNGVYKSRDGGTTWDTINEGLTNRVIYALLVPPAGSSTTVYAATRTGIFALAGKRPTAVATLPPARPDAYILAPNYPNPFNPRTTIRFSLPSAAVVSLHVYNLQGQPVATLVHRERWSTGTYEMEFDGSGLASGVYLYRLVAGDFQQVRRMMVLK